LNQPDLFVYPSQPGYKAPGTSRMAAERIAPRAKSIREEALALLKTASLTADEVAAKLGKSVLAVRPRIAEAHLLGLLIDTGKTRPNASGLAATVWKSAT
jgi:hypothetical protein